jgi:hypothetical protein
MNNLSGDTVTLSELVRTEEHGLNVNRLLFAKFLLMTGRLSEGTRQDRRRARESQPVVEESATDTTAAIRTA